MKNRFGFVAVVGPTNSGKSTLVNALVGEKVSIVSPRPQTTYHGVRGILSLPGTQIVFTDTPGLQNFRARVAQLLGRVTERNLEEADLALWTFDVSDQSFQKKLTKLKPKIEHWGSKETRLLCLNKCDKIAKLKLLPILAELYLWELFYTIIPVSAKKRDGLDRIVAEICSRLPEGEPLFPLGEKTDRGEQYLATEFIREQAYHRLREELPYSLWVELDQWEETPMVVTVFATIHVDSRSKKGIVIGRQGQKLKEIGQNARRALSSKFGRRVNLFLNVHCEPDWQCDRGRLQKYLEL